MINPWSSVFIFYHFETEGHFFSNSFTLRPKAVQLIIRSTFNVFHQVELEWIPTTEDIKKKILNNRDDFIFHLIETNDRICQCLQPGKEVTWGLKGAITVYKVRKERFHCIILHLSSENFFHVAPGRPAAQILTESEYFHVEIDDLYIFKLAASWDCFINVNMNTCSICLFF